MDRNQTPKNGRSVQPSPTAAQKQPPPQLETPKQSATPTNFQLGRPPLPGGFQMSPTSNGVLQGSMDDRQILLEKIKTLENKLSFYESEHNNHQNQLLMQRQSHEQELNQLKSQNFGNSDEKDKEIEKMRRKLEDIRNLKAAQEYTDSLMQNAGIKVLEIKIEELEKENQQLKDQNMKLIHDLSTAQNQSHAQNQHQILEEQKQRDQKVLATISQTMNLIAQEIEISDNRSIQSSDIEKTYQDRLQKLQKKLTELEQYIGDKDKTILEQETQISDLQDQIHEYIKQEDKARVQIRDKNTKIDELQRELKLMNESNDYKIQDMQNLVDVKENSLKESYELVTNKEIEIQRFIKQLRDAEEAVREYRHKHQEADDYASQHQQRMQDMQSELDQLKIDFETILNFKNELETLIEEQTLNIDQKNKRLAMVEETLRFREQDLEKKENLLRRMSAGTDETKKKLVQSEMKLRQLTQTTLKDMRTKFKDKLNEIEVLKEMVRSANKQAKAKDIDIQRLSNRIKRLEKMTELGKGIIQDAVSMDGGGVIEEANEINESENGFQTPLKGGNLPPQGISQSSVLGPRNDQLGLNPLNYSNVDDEVQMELLQAQQQRPYQIKASSIKTKIINQASANFRNSKQKEIEEALELDRMLEQERRNLSNDVFQKKVDQKYESYFNQMNTNNMKNNSTSIRGIFGAPSDDTQSLRMGDQTKYYDGMLPNLNVSKREQLEQELMAEINDSIGRKDKYMTPNLQGKGMKAVNKLNAAAYNGKQQQPSNAYNNDRHNSKNRVQL